MKLTFYKNQSPMHKLSKIITKLGETSYFKPITGASEGQPQFLLDNPISSDCNYIYWDFTDRYYFITDCTHDIAKTVTLTCYIDPLMSFSSKLSRQQFYFVRGAANINEMTDPNYPIGSIITVHHGDLQGWNDNLVNTAIGRQFVLRTSVGKAKTRHTVALTANQIVHHQDCNYQVIDDSGSIYGFFLEFQNKSIPPSGASINKGDLLTYDNKVYLVKDIYRENTPNDGYIFRFDIEYYEG